MQATIRMLTVMVSDMARSVEFYRDVLGLKEVTVSDGWSEFDAGGVTLALHPGKNGDKGSIVNGTDAGTLHVTLIVADIEAAVKDLRAQGVAVDGPRTLEGTDLVTATFSDPDGLSLGLEQDPVSATP